MNDRDEEQMITLKHGFVLTSDLHPRDSTKWLAVISDGSPQLGQEDCTILTLETFDRQSEIKPWFERMIIEQPWNRRN